MTKNMRHHVDSRFSWLFVFATLFLLALLGYQVYRGARFHKLGIPGIVEIEFDQPKSGTYPWRLNALARSYTLSNTPISNVKVCYEKGDGPFIGIDANNTCDPDHKKYTGCAQIALDSCGYASTEDQKNLGIFLYDGTSNAEGTFTVPH